MTAKRTEAVVLLKEAGKLDSTRARRLEAVSRIVGGQRLDTVAAEMDVHPATLREWLKTYRNKGVEALSKKRGRNHELLTAAIGDNRELLEGQLRASAPATWRWLNNEREIHATLASVYAWRQRLLKTGKL